MKKLVINKNDWGFKIDGEKHKQTLIVPKKKEYKAVEFSIILTALNDLQQIALEGLQRCFLNTKEVK